MMIIIDDYRRIHLASQKAMIYTKSEDVGGKEYHSVYLTDDEFELILFSASDFNLANDVLDKIIAVIDSHQASGPNSPNIVINIIDLSRKVGGKE